MKQLKSLIKKRTRLRLQGVPEEELVHCAVPGCDYEGKMITSPHTILKHGMTLEEYKEIYPNAQVTSATAKLSMAEKKREYWDKNPEAKIAFGKKISKAWEDPEHRKNYQRSIENRGPMSEETKEKKRESMKALYKQKLEEGRAQRAKGKKK